MDNDGLRLLSEDERARMLDEIARVALAVGRSRFPGQALDDLDIRAGSLARKQSPVERLGFLAHALPALEQQVRRIADAPRTELRREERSVTPPERARRVTPGALQRALREGSVRRLGETASRLCVDTPEHRAIRAFLQTISRDLAAIQSMADSAGETMIREEARGLRRRVLSLLSLPLWQEVADDPPAWRLPPPHALLADPRYAPIAQTMRRYRQAFRFDWANPLFHLPSREMWRLYETWVLFQTLAALLSLGCTPLQDDFFTLNQDRLAFALVKGRSARVRLTHPARDGLTLTYSPTFPAGSQSLSRTMQPDFALESGDRLWLLDAKFKAYAASGDEADDIDQMHAYRDAIITPEGRKRVLRAWCVFPGACEGPGREWITYGPAPASPVGAVRLRPGEGAARLETLLTGWIQAEFA